jgi:hypothetical protein
LRGAPHAFSRQLLDAAKGCYEAVVLYDFLELMCVNLEIVFVCAFVTIRGGTSSLSYIDIVTMGI